MATAIEYKGFKLVVTVENQLAGSEQRWRGRFDFWREDGSQPRLGIISRMEQNPADARKKALRIAKSIIDAERVVLDGAVVVPQHVLARH